jgi:radical SAM protein with 4Fe4S-binding SPASM domain
VRLRVGVVATGDGEDARAAVEDLAGLGVLDVKVDRMRQVGRGARDGQGSIDELCGRCADSSLAVLPTGDVVPCVFARWMRLGNLRTASLAEINAAAEPMRTQLRSSFGLRADECDPKKNECEPTGKDGDPKGCDPDYKKCDPWKNL